MKAYIKAYTRQYKLPEFEAEKAHRQIKEMQEQGLVTENEDCTYNCAVFMVKIYVMHFVWSVIYVKLTAC